MYNRSSRDEVFINTITGIILESLSDEKFGAEELVQKSGITRYKLSKKVRAATGRNINQFIRETRLRKALELLSDDAVTIAEVAYKTGFSSPAYFNKCFHDQYGYSPGRVKSGNVEDKSGIEDGGSISKEIWRGYLMPVVVLVLVAVIMLLVPLFRKGNDELPEKPGVVVMPFENLTNHPGWDYWERAIQRDLITTLASTREIEVRMEESVNRLMARGRLMESSISAGPVSARAISRKLQAGYFITGSFRKFQEKIRLDAHLIETDTRIVRQSFEVNSTSADESAMCSLIDSLRRKISNHLLISNIIHHNPYYQHLFSTPQSIEALRYYDNAFRSDNPAEDIIWLKKAILADTTFYRAALALEHAYSAADKTDSSRMWLVRNYKNRYRMQDHDRLTASWAYAFTFESCDEQIRYLSELKKLDDEEPSVLYLMGMTHCLMKNYDKAIPELEKSLKIFKRWGPEFLKDARNCRNFKWLGIAYHNTGQYENEKLLYRKAERFIISHPWFDLMNANVSYHERDTAKAILHIDRAIVKFRQQFSSESEVMVQAGRYFKDMGNYDVAEIFYRKAISLSPGDLATMIHYADFCITSNRYNDPDLFERAMNMCADKQTYCEFMAGKGMCLHQRGQSYAALDLIQKAWDEAPFKVYEIKVNLDKVKKSVPSLKSGE